MRRTDIQLTSPEQLAAYVRSAVRVADETDLSAEDRLALLPRILDLLAARQIFWEQPQQVPLGLLNGIRKG